MKKHLPCLVENGQQEAQTRNQYSLVKI